MAEGPSLTVKRSNDPLLRDTPTGFARYAVSEMQRQ